jgi:hypothetical protein
MIDSLLHLTCMKQDMVKDFDKQLQRQRMSLQKKGRSSKPRGV